MSRVAESIRRLADRLTRTGRRLTGDDHRSRRAAFDEAVDRRIEKLRDLQWEIRDNEARYRDLLDTLEAVVLRRGADGRLTFVNLAFCRVFGVQADQIVGHRFEPLVLDGDHPTSSISDGEPRRSIALVETTAGPRWYSFEEHCIATSGSTGPEIQVVGRDVTDERRIKMDLAEARDQAEAASRAKSRFLAAMSHEIRTPMNGILGMIRLLLETPLTSEQVTYARAVKESAGNLLTLIDEILDFSKVEAGRLDLNKAPFALESCVQSAVELLAPRAHEKGLEIAWTVDPGLPRLVHGDETRVRQVLLNLVGNAIKFTDRGGVLVSVEAVSPPGPTVRLVVRVEDSGIGIAASALPGLFTEFEQATAVVTQQRGGTGLGLAISRRLVRAMGGSIEVSSAEGQGAVFTVRLELEVVSGEPMIAAREIVARPRVLLAFEPGVERRAMAETLRRCGLGVVEAALVDAGGAIERAAAAHEPIERIIARAITDGDARTAAILAQARTLADGRSVAGSLLVDAASRLQAVDGFDTYLVRPVRMRSLLVQIGALKSPARTLAGMDERAASDDGALGSDPVPGGPLRVLLAEDNAINALLARNLLERAGCVVDVVGNGRAAVERVARHAAGGIPIDIVLMDVHMPEMSGLEAAAAIGRIAPAHGCSLPPIVALTANAFAEDRKRCLDAGMVDYLAKPFDVSDLAGVLRRWSPRRSGPSERRPAGDAA